MGEPSIGEQNVAVVGRWADALRRGELAPELWDPELEIVNAKGWALEATYRGREGLRRWWADLAEAFSDLALDIEITPLDDEHVLLVNRWVGQFRSTGIPFDGPWAAVVTVRAGRMIHAVGYLTKEQAARASKRGSAHA